MAESDHDGSNSSEEEQPKEGLDFTDEGLEAWNRASDRFDEALLNAATAKSKARGSKYLDAPEIEEATRFVLVASPRARWKRVCRMVLVVAYVLGGWSLREAFRSEASPQEFGIFLLIGIVLLVLPAILQESVLQ